MADVKPKPKLAAVPRPDSADILPLSPGERMPGGADAPALKPAAMPPVIARPQVSRGARLGRMLWLWLALLIPGAAGAWYWLWIASDVYVARAQFYLEQEKNDAAAMDLGSLLASSSPSKDPQRLMVYAHSANMLALLERDLALRAHYSEGRWDRVSRLPPDASQEDFLRYYQDRVVLTFEPESDILTMEAQAYTPEMALALARKLVENSLQFTLHIDETIGQRRLTFMRSQLENAKQSLSEINASVVAMQRRLNVIDPQLETDLTLGIIGNMTGELANVITELETKRGILVPDAPELQQLQYRRRVLEQMIEEWRTRATGRKDPELDQELARLQQLQLDLKFATDFYQNTLKANEVAQIDALSSLRHLIIVEEAMRPDEAILPHRVYETLTLLVIVAAIFFSGRLLGATIREHAD